MYGAGVHIGLLVTRLDGLALVDILQHRHPTGMVGKGMGIDPREYQLADCLEE